MGHQPIERSCVTGYLSHTSYVLPAVCPHPPEWLSNYGHRPIEKKFIVEIMLEYIKNVNNTMFVHV